MLSVTTSLKKPHGLGNTSTMFHQLSYTGTLTWHAVRSRECLPEAEHSGNKQLCLKTLANFYNIRICYQPQEGCTGYPLLIAQELMVIDGRLWMEGPETKLITAGRRVWSHNQLSLCPPEDIAAWYTFSMLSFETAHFHLVHHSHCFLWRKTIFFILICENQHYKTFRLVIRNQTVKGQYSVQCFKGNKFEPFL